MPKPFVRAHNESLESAFDRAIGAIVIADQKVKKKQQKCKRLEAKLEKIKALNLKNLPIHRELAEMKAENLENQDIIHRLKDENKDLETRNAKKDRLIESYKNEKRNHRCHLHNATGNNDGAINDKPQTMGLSNKKNDTIKPLKRKASNDISSDISSNAIDVGVYSPEHSFIIKSEIGNNYKR